MWIWKLILTTTAIILGLSVAAQAKFRICNETAVSQSVSIAYKDGDQFKSEGWWNVSSGECKTLISASLKSRYMYYRATAKGRSFTGESYYFCTLSKAYTIIGNKNCKKRGYKREEFREIDTGKTATEFKLTLVDPKQQSTVPTPSQNNTDTESGSLGEPFAVSAVFQGCDVMDGAQYCAFHADGWKWFAWYGSGTSNRILNAMQNLPSGSLLDVSGDLVSYGDITTEVVIRKYTSHGPRGENENTIAGIQGNWVSVDDRQSRMVIKGGEAYEYYGNEFIGTSYIRVADQCDNSNGAGPVLIKREPETQESYCYVILGWDAVVLQLSYVGGIGSGDLMYEKSY